MNDEMNEGILSDAEMEQVAGGGFLGKAAVAIGSYIIWEIGGAIVNAVDDLF
jgi:hypothetical protein